MNVGIIDKSQRKTATVAGFTCLFATIVVIFAEATKAWHELKPEENA